MIAGGNRSNDYVSAKLTGGAKKAKNRNDFLSPALRATSLVRGRQGASAPVQLNDKLKFE